MEWGWGNERLAAAGFKRGRRREWETVLTTVSGSFCGRVRIKRKAVELGGSRGGQDKLHFFLMWKD